MNTYIFYITYKDGYTDEFEVVASNRMMATVDFLVTNEYEICFNEVTHISIELKEGEEE